VQRLCKLPQVVDIPYEQFLVEQHDVGALRQRLLRIGQSPVSVDLDLSRVAVLLDDSQSDRHLHHTPFNVLTLGASALLTLGCKIQ